MNQTKIMRTVINWQRTQAAQVQAQKRTFASNAIYKPHRYKNLFNKKTSRDGKITFFETYPHDYNEPWPLPPVYRKNGEDVNRDPVWGQWGRAPNSSITGKPKRALGHYPWLGRAIVPGDDDRMYIFDDCVAPYPCFRIGKMRYEWRLWSKWFAVFAVFWGLNLFFDQWYAKHVSYSWQRDQLCYREQVFPDHYLTAPVAITTYAVFDSPLHYRFAYQDNWRDLGTHTILPQFRYENVYVPCAKDDMYAEEHPHKYWPTTQIKSNPPSFPGYKAPEFPIIN